MLGNPLIWGKMGKLTQTLSVTVFMLFQLQPCTVPSAGVDVGRGWVMPVVLPVTEVLGLVSQHIQGWGLGCWIPWQEAGWVLQPVNDIFK